VQLRDLALVGLVAALACNGPFGLLPGGKLDGDPKPVPAAWEPDGENGVGQLETRPNDPYSVNLVYTVLDGNLYINAGDTRTEWVKNIEADPAVRLRIRDTLYDLEAVRVTDREEIVAFGAAWTSQSMFRRDPAELDPVWIYRLVAR